MYKKFQNAGGQALIEGVMMKCGSSKAIAIRKKDGEIILKKDKNKGVANNLKCKKWPFIRGIFVLIESMVEGGKDLTYSANIYAEGIEEEKSKFEIYVEKILGKNAEKVMSIFSILLSILFAIAVFIIIPTYFAKGSIDDKTIFVSLREGIIKLVIFSGYLILISQFNDIKRVFEYHGAEHKTIFAYEEGKELSVENVKKMSRFHPRCGTNFMFVVITVSILIFSFINIRTLWLRSLLKLICFPLVSGISYEIIRLAGKYNNFFTNIMVAPGLIMQRITTREPDDSQIEVAIASLKSVLEDEGIIDA